MPLIRIREQQCTPQHTRAVLSFDGQGEFPLSLTNPFSEQEEKRLEWYFEEHLQFPFTDQVKAGEAALSIKDYGEQLFEQVFRRNADAYAAYKQAAQQGIDHLVIEIAGSPEFHRLHWESLKDPHLGEPLAVHAPIVRKNLVPQPFPARPKVSATLNLLLVVARPGGKRDVGYRTISRPLVETLRQARLPVEVEIIRPGTYEALVRHLQEAREDPARGTGHYHLIHFDLHGSLSTYEQLQSGIAGGNLLYQHRYGRGDLQPYSGQKAFLWFVGTAERPHDPVEAGELAELLKTHQVPIALLNACQSGKQVGQVDTSLGSRLIQAGMQMVLAMGYSVTVSAAELLMKALYEQLLAGGDLALAIRAGRYELYNRKGRRAYFNQLIDLEDWLLPVVYQNSAVPLTVRAMTTEENRTFHERRARRYRGAEPTYGFHGRDVDVLEVERRLCGTATNVLLIRGMGGAGKTTFLQHLAGWWQTTGLVDQVFYFGYDEKAWNRQQIMRDIAKELLRDIAKELLSPRDYEDYFQPLSPEAQQEFLAQRLRASRHLLILDNLESVTGTALAIKHTLRPKEQEHLRSFVQELKGGKTLVLLGSRGSEEWLAPGTFEDNVYDLPGLDAEAASALADHILERNNATKWRKDADLARLLKLLDGYPLALEVVLANLARQRPAEVLAALEAGDVALDTGDGQSKTRSILRCVEYSHSNLEAALQELLACLAPFTSVFNTTMMPAYTKRLKEQPALAELPFERWQETLQEAESWGLARRQPQMESYLLLQPILPYFLRGRLDHPSQQERRAAIETAFREHYDEVARGLYRWAKSKEVEEEQIGLAYLGLEYENIATALNLALRAHESITSPCSALLAYLASTKDHGRGLELGERVLAGLEKYPSEHLRDLPGLDLIAVLDEIGSRQLALKRPAEAKRAFEKALALLLENSSIDEADRRQMSATILRNLGAVALEQRQWQQAEQHFQEALRIFVEFNDRQSQAYAYHHLGLVAQEQRQWQQAESHYQQSLRIKIEFNDRHSQADTYHQLGLVAQKQRQWQQAESHYQQALLIRIEFNNRYSQASTYHNLGIVAQDQRQWQQAEQHYQQALRIFVEFNDSYSQASSYHQLGLLAQKQRQWQQAELYYQASFRIYVEFNDRHSQAGSYHQLGVVAQEQQQWQQAKSYYLESLGIYAEAEDIHSQVMVLRSLARLWQASADASLPAAVAGILHVEPAEVEMEKMLRGEGDSQ
jgi:tetratricopeptide (TPR) repeat protein